MPKEAEGRVPDMPPGYMQCQSCKNWSWYPQLQDCFGDRLIACVPCNGINDLVTKLELTEMQLQFLRHAIAALAAEVEF
jgi:hypothetical protein